MSWHCRFRSPTHTHPELECMWIYKGMLRSDELPRCRFAAFLLDRSCTVAAALEPTLLEFRGFRFQV